MVWWAIHTGIAHGALRIYGVNGPQAPHTWEPAGSKPSSPIGRELANPALWLVETRLCHSHHPRVHSAHTPQGTLLDCKTSLTFLRIPEKPNRVASCINRNGHNSYFLFSHCPCQLRHCHLYSKCIKIVCVMIVNICQCPPIIIHHHNNVLIFKN